MHMSAVRTVLWKTGVTMAWQNSKDDIRHIEAVTAWQYIAVHPTPAIQPETTGTAVIRRHALVG